MKRPAKNAKKTMNFKVKKSNVLKSLQALILMELNVGISLTVYYANLLIQVNVLSVQEEVFPLKIYAFVKMKIKY